MRYWLFYLCLCWQQRDSLPTKTASWCLIRRNSVLHQVILPLCILSLTNLVQLVLKNLEAIPLFQYTVFARSNGAVVVNKPVALIILCRVAAGKGDYLLADVERNMLEKISIPMPLNAYSEHKAYLHRTANHTEKEMILNLEDAVNLQYT